MNRAERRRQTRAPLWATATLSLPTRDLGSFQVVNLSAGGALLVGDIPAPLGAPVRAVLRLPAGQAVPVEAALVRRDQSRQGSAFALAFTALATPDEALIQQAVTAALDEARAASVLIVGESPDESAALSAELNALGWRAFAVRSSLEAAHVLDEPNHLSLAVVDMVLGAGDKVDLLAYLAERHPAVRRVLLSESTSLYDLDRARSALTFSIHAVLHKPWSREELARVLQSD
jgi:CheY-like chemotaxis protein